MDRQTFLLGVSLAVLLALVGFYGAFLYEEKSNEENDTQSFPLEMNVTVNSEEEIRTASFDNRSLNLMAEDSEEARFYLDFNRDGSFDREVDIKHESTVRNTSELVELKNKSYRLYLQYRDDPSISSDAFMTLFRVAKP